MHNNNFYVVNTRVLSCATACTNVYTTSAGSSSGYIRTTAENMQGLDVLTNASKMEKLAEYGAFLATESYPTLKVFPYDAETFKITFNANGGTHEQAIFALQIVTVIPILTFLI